MDKRSFLKRVIFGVISLCASWPLYRFVTAERFRPPKKVTVAGSFRAGQHVMEHDFALFVTPDGPVAISRRCTHLGCIINYDESKEQFICPCHQSRFTRDGHYIAGPAKRDLPRYEVRTLEDNRGYVVLVT
jgi:nitrite reductase/ring-hydroxylating ferredoxin subunit